MRHIPPVNIGVIGYGEILASCCKVPVEGKNRRDCSKMVGQALVMIDLSV